MNAEQVVSYFCERIADNSALLASFLAFIFLASVMAVTGTVRLYSPDALRRQGSGVLLGSGIAIYLSSVLLLSYSVVKIHSNIALVEEVNAVDLKSARKILRKKNNSDCRHQLSAIRRLYKIEGILHESVKGEGICSELVLSDNWLIKRNDHINMMEEMRKSLIFAEMQLVVVFVSAFTCLVGCLIIFLNKRTWVQPRR